MHISKKSALYTVNIICYIYRRPRDSTENIWLLFTWNFQFSIHERKRNMELSDIASEGCITSISRCSYRVLGCLYQKIQRPLQPVACTNGWLLHLPVTPREHWGAYIFYFSLCHLLSLLQYINHMECHRGHDYQFWRHGHITWTNHNLSESKNPALMYKFYKRITYLVVVNHYSHWPMIV